MHSLANPESRLRLGLASADITPPVGIYHRTWGAATHDRATGVHRPLVATALALKSLDERPGLEGEQVIVAMDHCLFWAAEMAEFLDRVSGSTGLHRDQITVAFSHTHAAGLLGRERASLPGGDMIGPYLEQLAATCGRIVGEARASAQPVTIGYAAGQSPMGAHRDYYDSERGEIVCGFNPAGSCDETVLVARASDDAGRAVATLVNYGCHPTTLAWENTLISPDFPGALRELVERATGAPCVFVQGASGDVGPRHGHQGDTAVADKNGRALGYAALAAVETLPPPGRRFEYAGAVVSGATLGSWRYAEKSPGERRAAERFGVRRFSVSLPKRPGTLDETETLRRMALYQEQERAAKTAGDALAARDARAMVERMERQRVRIAALPSGATFELPVVLLALGEAMWVLVEGEPYNVLQRELRRRFPGKPVLVGVLANGSRPSYLPPADLYEQEIYQVSIAMLAPGALEQLIEAVAGEMGGWGGSG